MDIRSRSPIRPWAMAALAGLLAACGSSQPTTAPLSVGVLTDAPIKGVEYLTTGNLGGTTNGSGEFSYRPGDTIVFKIGLLPIGVITGTGSTMTVTPLQLVESQTVITDPALRKNAVTNMLVLLQSLDTDANPDNGIEIPASAITALQDVTLRDALNNHLTDDPDTFKAGQPLTDLLTATGGTAVAPADALAHFRTQFLASLAGQYYGTLNGSLFVFRFRSDGSYLMTEVQAGDAGAAPVFTAGGQPGLERGTITWDPASGQVTTTTTLDTNGSRGFSGIDAVNAPLQLTVDAGDLIYTRLDANGDVVSRTRFARVANSTTGPAGAWAKDDSVALGKPMLFLLPENRFVLLDPVGDTSFLYDSVPVSCGNSGVEVGSWQSVGSMLEFSAMTFDSTGCAGVYEHPVYLLPPYVALGTGAGTMTWTTSVGTQSFYRPQNDLSLLP